LDLDESDIDALALRLMEGMVAKRKIPKNRPGHISERRKQIPEAMVDYLIVTILESMNHDDQPTTIPFSLVVLIRDRLCGAAPDLHATYRLKEQQRRALFMTLAAAGSSSRPISIRKFATLNGISKTTSARWLNDPTFRRRLESIQSEEFKQHLEQLHFKAKALEEAGIDDPEVFLKIVQRHLADAKNEIALQDAWQVHVEPVKAILFPSDYAECVNMFERRMLEIAAEYVEAHPAPALWFWSV
jgi:hypothetical protein